MQFLLETEPLIVFTCTRRMSSSLSDSGHEAMEFFTARGAAMPALQECKSFAPID